MVPPVRLMSISSTSVWTCTDGPVATLAPWSMTRPHRVRLRRRRQGCCPWLQGRPPLRRCRTAESAPARPCTGACAAVTRRGSGCCIHGRVVLDPLDVVQPQRKGQKNPQCVSGILSCHVISRMHAAGGGYRIDATRVPGMAAAQSPQGEPAAVEDTEAVKRLESVIRTRGMKNGIWDRAADSQSTGTGGLRL